MNIPLESLHAFVKLAVDAGVQEYIRNVEPEGDRIKQADAKRYIARMGFRPAMLKKWEDASLLTPVKTGARQNAAVWYSLAEIKKVICAARLKVLDNGSVPVTGEDILKNLKTKRRV